MSNNTEYVREYVDNVENYFRELERKIQMPARDRTLTYQQVEEFFARFSEADAFKDYLLDNVWIIEGEREEMEEQIEEYEKVKKALLRLKVQLDTFYHCIPDKDEKEVTDRDQYEKYVDMLDALAEGEIPEELKEVVKVKKPRTSKGNSKY